MVERTSGDAAAQFVRPIALAVPVDGFIQPALQPAELAAAEVVVERPANRVEPGAMNWAAYRLPSVYVGK